MINGMAKLKEIPEYLAATPATQRAGLKRLRNQIKKLYPTVTEHIGYGMPFLSWMATHSQDFEQQKNIPVFLFGAAAH